MTISNETLMAFADGELHGAEHDAVLLAVTADAELQRRVESHRALRARLQRAFADELTEPVHARLIAAVRQAAAPASAAVTNLQEARASAARKIMHTRANPYWRVGSMAASLLIGVGFGYLVSQQRPARVQEQIGVLTASPTLADVLTHRLAADQSATAIVRVGVSFLAKSGQYCRTFSTAGEQAASGLACRAGRDWQVQALIPASDPEPRTSDFRTAGSAMSPLILQLMGQQRVGDPLDSQGEDAARRSGWAKESR